MGMFKYNFVLSLAIIAGSVCGSQVPEDSQPTFSTIGSESELNSPITVPPSSPISPIAPSFEMKKRISYLHLVPCPPVVGKPLVKVEKKPNPQVGICCLGCLLGLIVFSDSNPTESASMSPMYRVKKMA